MANFVDTLESLLKEQNITKNKMLTDLHLSKNSIVDWRKRGTIPSASVISAIAEYLGTTMGYLLGNPDQEEALNTFAEKLLFQLDVKRTNVQELSEGIGVPPETITKWILNGDDSYKNYISQLSSFFEVLEHYWTTPAMISPGITLTNADEYMLVLLFRDYKKTGVLNTMAYGDLCSYFPCIKNTPIRSVEDDNWLSLIHSLPQNAREKFRSEMEVVLKYCGNEVKNSSDDLKQAK